MNLDQILIRAPSDKNLMFWVKNSDSSREIHFNQNVDFWFEIHEWLSTFIQILSENFRFSSEPMIDYTLFVCLYSGIAHDFVFLFKIMQIFQNFSWEKKKLLRKLDKIFANFEFYYTTQIGFHPQESQFLYFCRLNIFWVLVCLYKSEHVFGYFAVTWGLALRRRQILTNNISTGYCQTSAKPIYTN